MKTPGLLLCLLVGLTASAAAQDAAPMMPPAVQVQSHRTPAEIDQLLGPIALYPDALIALILPAATSPADIVLAARYLQDANGDLSQVENRAWDDSVKSLAHYPDVLKWMDENLEWTKQVGEAFTEEPAEVMKSIQRLRARARAAGTLIDTPQQQILSTPDVIRIVPAQPDVIYIPRYEPAMVYVDRPVFYPQPVLTFGVGLPVGAWLAYDCNWTQRTLWVGDRYRRWRGHDWRTPVVPVQTGYTGAWPAHQWKPPMRLVRPAPTRPIQQLPVQPAYAPRPNYVPGFQRDYPGPRAADVNTTRISSLPNAAPALAATIATVQTRRPAPDQPRNQDTPARSAPPGFARAAPLPVVPPLTVVAPPSPSAPIMGPRAQFGQVHPATAPVIAPPMPAVARPLPVAPSLPDVAPPPASPAERSERTSRRGDRVLQY